MYEGLSSARPVSSGTLGSPCRSPAMPNGRCRMHGGASPGAPKGKANGNYRHGQFTRQALAECRQVAALIRLMMQSARQVEPPDGPPVSQE